MKIIIFGKGKLFKEGNEEVYIDGSKMKIVTEYKYLVIIFNPQL